MDKIYTPYAPEAIGPYSQAVVLNGMVYTSGQIAIDPATGELSGADIQTQTKQVMENLGHVLEACQSDFSHVVKTTCFLSDINDFVPFNEVYATAFKTDFPARSAVEVARLPKDVKVEIEVIAYLD